MTELFTWTGIVIWGLIALALLSILGWVAFIFLRCLSFIGFWVISAKILGNKIGLNDFAKGIGFVLKTAFWGGGLDPMRTIAGDGLWSGCLRWRLPRKTASV